MGASRRQGFTLIEIMIVVAVIGVLSAIAAPQMQAWLRDQRVKAAARSVADAFMMARSEAIRTGRNHVVFFQADTGGNPLPDEQGNPVPVLVLDDGAPGSANQNCQIDAGEITIPVRGERDVNWGVASAGFAVPTDTGAAPFAAGASFVDTAGNPTTWVVFRPDGIPVSASAACVQGNVGSGGGAIYITNVRRDYAVVLQPLGGVRVHAWDANSGQWRQ